MYQTYFTFVHYETHCLLLASNNKVELETYFRNLLKKKNIARKETLRKQLDKRVQMQLGGVAADAFKAAASKSMQQRPVMLILVSSRGQA